MPRQQYDLQGRLQRGSVEEVTKYQNKHIFSFCRMEIEAQWRRFP